MRELALLTRHFFGRFFDKESLSPQADPSANLGPLLGLLAAPAGVFAIVAQPLTLVRWDLVFFRFIFLNFSMVAMAFVVVLKWDALFPDLRDYLILTPLPLRTPKLLCAKVLALGGFLGLILCALNFFGVLFWPGLDQGKGSLAIMGAHALAMAAGGLFAALAAASIQGLLTTLLPARVFRLVITWVQTLLMAALTTVLFLTPMLAAGVRQLINARSEAVYWFPGYWFIGLYEFVRPATRNPVLLHLGRVGWIALACAAGTFAATYLLGFARQARRVLESAPADPRGPGRLRRSISAALDGTLLTTPVQRAVFHFIGQTIARSAKHRIFLAVYGGFGAALGVMTFAAGPEGLLRLPLTLSFVLVSGLRAAFNFPSDLRANWAFQLTETNSPAEYMRAMRKWMVACAVAPLFAVVAPFEFRASGWMAIFHLAFGFASTLLLIEAMFFGFRKAAFTCAYFPGRMNLVGLTVIYLFGFTMYTDTMTSVETWAAGGIGKAALSLAVIAGASAVTAWFRARQPEADVPLDYQGAADPAVRTIAMEAN